MSHLIGPTPTLLAALCLLVLVGSLPAVRSASALLTRLAPWLAMLTIIGTAAAFWRLLERPGTLPDTFPGKIAKYAANELNAATEPTVLIIDGGSYVLNGVDCDDLMAELKELGHAVKAVRLAAGASNHFERYRLQQRVVERLAPRRPHQRWVFLAETQHGYDTSPVSQFTENPTTDRAYDYSSLGNARAEIRALASPGVTVPDEWRWDLFKGTMINSFNVGVLLRTADEDELETGGGVVSKRGRSQYKKFPGMKKQLRLLSKRPRASVLPWLVQIREPRIRELWRPFLDELVYFGLPTSAPYTLEYVRNFCAGTKRPCITPDAKLLESLDGAKFWRDKSHLNKRGATVYTRWLARQLVEQGVVK